MPQTRCSQAANVGIAACKKLQALVLSPLPIGLMNGDGNKRPANPVGIA